jgi:recombination protein RecR
MDPIERLSRLFEKFPGIGPRQASRFVAYLLRSSPALRREIAQAVQDLGGSVRQCDECQRFHTGTRKICSICENPERDGSVLAIVSSDTDLAALERSGTYRGRYFVLGGTISLASEKTNGLRLTKLIEMLGSAAKSGISELILAFPANPEGDATTIRVREDISAAHPHIRITALGRGLSTGSELEYADPETIKSAIESRR